MTPIADMVAEMLAKGVAADVIVLAVRSAEMSRNVPGTVPGQKREYERARKAEWRAKRSKIGGSAPADTSPRFPQLVPNVPGTIGDNLPLYTESASKIQSTQNSKKDRAVVLKTRGARLPDDWCPGDKEREYAAGRGLSSSEIDDEGLKFRNYWTNRTDKQGAKPRWDRAWQNWILNVRKTPNGKDKSLVAAADRFNAKLASFGEQRELLGGARGPESAPTFRLLPPGRGG